MPAARKTLISYDLDYGVILTDTWDFLALTDLPPLPPGPPGPPGAGGATGPPGAGGATGPPGSVWYDGVGAPAGGLGIDGDYYLRHSNGDVSLKVAGSWSVVVNILGPTGATGAAGSVWYNGAGAPAGGLGVNGDYYLNDTNGDVYFKLTGSWSVIATTIGPTGATGAGGAAGPPGAGGATGPPGAGGATGPPGPNSVTAATTTNLTGILSGDGANVGTATLAGGLSFSGGTLTGQPGTVTTVSVVAANGFNGIVSTATTTPAITLGTGINGLVKGDGTGLGSATVTGGLTFAAGVLSTGTDLSALESLASTGYAVRTATDTWAQRTFTAGTATTVTNGTGVSGNTSINVVGLTTTEFAANVVDTDATLAANSTTRLPSQSAVKSYVDNLLTGLAWKQAVRVATTANGALATAYENGDTVDGVVLATGDRILLKNQTTGAENGIYTVNASGAPTRSTDADTGNELVSATVLVRAGTVGADTQWTCTNDAITLNTTAVVFAQIAGAGTYTAGSGITLTANVFSIAAAAVTFAMIQNLTALSVLGKPTSGSGVMSAITASGDSQFLSQHAGVLGFSSLVSGDLPTIALTGVVTASAAGGNLVTTIAANQVTSAMFRQSVAVSVVGVAGAATANVADIVAGADAQFLSRHAGAIAFAAIVAADLPAATTAAKGATVLADQATMETATDTAKSVTPQGVKWHPGCAKAWISFTVASTVITVRSSYNMTAARTGTGLYTVTETAAMSAAAAQCPVVACGASGQRMRIDLVSFSSATSSAIALATTNVSGTLTDPDWVTVVVFGDFA